MPKLLLLKRIASSIINTLDDDPSAFFYESGLQIDADGAYRAYHPDNKPGLDYLANAGKPGNWWALVTDNGKPSGKPVIQSDGDPAPGYYISMTSLEDSSKDSTDPRRYVDSESINYFVLPGKLALKAKLGDFGVVIRPKTGAYDYAIYADSGPANKLGEGSISLAASLGIPSNPKKGGVDKGIITIVFPGTTKGWPLTQIDIDSNGSALFAKWGGLDKAKECFPDADWSDGPEIKIAMTF
jgi:Fungal chitosanase of glycosyl hydrolase group 75